MKQAIGYARLINLAIILASCAAATISDQNPNELTSTARERIEQAGASIVMVKAVDESNQTISQAVGFFVRKDLIATDIQIDRNARDRVTVITKAGTFKVLSAGNYVLPYVLLERPAEVSPLSLADSEQVAINDSVYMLDDAGKIVSGNITGSTTIKNTQAFLISLPINANNKGAPIFNRYGEVIGIAAKSLDGQSAGLAWPSDLLASLKHLGEPGVGVGRGDGLRFPIRPATTDTGSTVARTVDTKPVRLSSPPPRYTEAARANGTQGSVLLSVLVAEDGNVKDVRVVRGLPDGLTEQAIDAARHAKFKPATKDGKAVAYWIGLEMNFNIR